MPTAEEPPSLVRPAAGTLLAHRARRQHFPLAQVRLFLRAVLQLPTSLRAAAAIFPLLWKEGLVAPELSKGPSAAGGRLWLLRVGLYELQRPKERAEDWVWIVDHTIQLGTTRVLVIVGLRLSVWEAQARGALTHQDLQVLLLEPVQQSNAQQVASQLARAAQISGPPRAILSDQCRELRNAVEQFQAAHRQTLGLNDLKHRLALLLERQLKPDPRWSDFLSACQQIRKQSQQTWLAFLAPPATKEKARFMNLGELIRWASAARAFLDRPEMPAGVPLDRQRLETVFAVLRQYDAALVEWQALVDMIDAALRHVREEGYYRGCDRILRWELAPWANQPGTQPFVEQVLAFVAEQSCRLKLGEHLPGTSEVLESLIGKGKRLEGQQSKGGFTRMILGLAAAVVNPTSEYLQQALESIGTKHVAQWAQTYLGASFQGLRQQTLGRLKAEQIRDKQSTATSPSC